MGLGARSPVCCVRPMKTEVKDMLHRVWRSPNCRRLGQRSLERGWWCRRCDHQLDVCVSGLGGTGRLWHCTCPCSPEGEEPAGVSGRRRWTSARRGTVTSSGGQPPKSTMSTVSGQLGGFFPGPSGALTPVAR